MGDGMMELVRFQPKYGIKPLRCRVCGAVYYRQRSFAPAPNPCYKGEEIIQVEFCGSISQDRDQSGAMCRGLLEIIPGGMFDLLPEGFEIDMEMFEHGDRRKVRVSSLSELRKIENLSLKKHANGEGEPLIWRDLSQDKANKAVHTLRDTPYERHRAAPRVDQRRTQSGLDITGSAIESLPE